MTYLIPTISIIIGAILVYRGFENIKLARLVENIPTSKIRSVAIGLVEIRGKALPYDKPLKSPISKKDCVYYELDINAGEYNKYKVSSNEKFYLKDETGKILIDPKFAKTVLPLGYEDITSFGNTPKEVIQLLKDRNMDYKQLERYQHPIKYTETIIKPFKDIYVLGTASSAEYDDLNTASHETILIKKDKTNKTMYISYRSEKNTVRDLHNDNPLMIYLGVTMIVLGIFFIIKFPIIGV